jgi:hypothetical protein
MAQPQPPARDDSPLRGLAAVLVAKTAACAREQPPSLAFSLSLGLDQAQALLRLLELAGHQSPRDDFSTDPRMWTSAKLRAEAAGNHPFAAVTAELQRRMGLP